MAREVILNIELDRNDLEVLGSEGSEIVEFGRRKMPRIDFRGLIFHSWHLEVDGSYTFIFGDEAALLTW